MWTITRVRSALCGSIVTKTCFFEATFGRISVAKLDSHGPDLFGALVPVPESDFGCRGPLFGGELTLKKANPAESLSS